MLIRIEAVVSTPTKKTPKSTPQSEPRPPLKATPPSRIAVSTCSSRPTPIDSEAPSSSEVRIRPPRAAASAREDVEQRTGRRDGERRARAPPCGRRRWPSGAGRPASRTRCRRRPGTAPKKITPGPGCRDQVPLPSSPKRVAEAEPGHVVGDRLGQAAGAGEAAERHDDRREAEVGDQDAVHQAPGRPDQRSRPTMARPDRLVVDLGQLPNTATASTATEPDREVDVARQHQHGARDRDEPDDRHLQQDDLEVRVREEVVAARRRRTALSRIRATSSPPLW